MDGIVIASVALLIVLVFGLSYVSYRRPARAAEAKSAAALAQLLAEGEQLAALGPDANEPRVAATPSPPSVAPTATRAPEAPLTAVQEAFERGYRQGFRDGLAGSDVSDGPTP